MSENDGRTLRCDVVFRQCCTSLAERCDLVPDRAVRDMRMINLRTT